MKRAESILQNEKECFVTGRRDHLDLHHIYAGSRRKASDRYGCWCWLTHDIHMELHDRNKTLDKMLRVVCQERFEEIYSHEEFMAVFQKNYLGGSEDGAA